MAEIDSAMEEKLLGDDQNAEGKKEGGILLQGSMYTHYRINFSIECFSQFHFKMLFQEFFTTHKF